jgi:glutamate-ammonia-ligase adenylyltransferase
MLVLAHAHRRPELTANAGNIALLKLAAKLELIPGDSAGAVRDAYREFRRRQHRLRLNGAKYARVPAAEVQGYIDATRALWRRVFGKE